jgi:hypothetical protein
VQKGDYAGFFSGVSGGRLSPAPLPARISNCGGGSAHEMKNDGHNGQQQENVNKKRSDVKDEKASQPQQKQNYSES